MTSIVEQLARWTKENSEKLRNEGVQLTEKFPLPDSDFPWKATVWLVHNGILASYTVWERYGFETELIVMNDETKQTIIVDEKRPEKIQSVCFDLDSVVKGLLSGSYKNMEPDPNLDIF